MEFPRINRLLNDPIEETECFSQLHLVAIEELELAGITVGERRDWHERIVLPNPEFGLVFGDDSGYRDFRPLDDGIPETKAWSSMMGPASSRKNFGLVLICVQIQTVFVEAVLHHADIRLQQLR